MDIDIDIWMCDEDDSGVRYLVSAGLFTNACKENLTRDGYEAMIEACELVIKEARERMQTATE